MKKADDSAPAVKRKPGRPRKSLDAAPKTKQRKARRAAIAAAPSSDRKFGYFSDGTLALDCASCKGTLSEADLKALRDFTRRFEGPGK